MFIPVACNRCGKPFQVPDADAGKEVVCPWCKATVAALPVATAATSGQPTPLSLDDAPPASPVLPPDRRRVTPGIIGCFAALLTILLAVGVGLLGYGSGRIPNSAWRSFTPTDRNFTVDLPGTPTAETLEPIPGKPTLGGEMYTVRGWYSGAVVWAGWRDVSAVVAPAAAGNPEGWVIYRPAIDAEIKRRREMWDGTVTREATIQFNDPQTVEVRMSTPSGNLVERFFVATGGPRTRLYFVGIRAKDVTPDSSAAQRLFGSFRVNKE